MPRRTRLSILVRGLVAAILTPMILAPASAWADDDPPPGPAGLAGTAWRFVDAVGVAVPPDPAATLEFAADGTVAGSAGCNRYFGGYTATGADQLSFSQVGSTKMWCGPDIMRIESAVLSAVNRTGTAAVGPDRLELRATDGTVLAHLVPAADQSPAPGVLAYEIVVTDPGSRSQGWRGVLYDSAGKPVAAAPGTTVSTPVGQFLDVPCDVPWTPCGMIRTDMAEWMKTNQMNIVFDDVPWSYRLYVADPGTRDERWTGVLRHGDQQVEPAATPVDTPMGPFRSAGTASTGPSRSGWFPAGWQ